MKVVFHPDAEAELIAAIEYYEACHPGLGLDFAIEANLALDRASQYPEAWPLLELPFRRVLFNRFPFGLIYIVDDKSLLVIAVMNLHREPNYWKSRR